MKNCSQNFSPMMEIAFSDAQPSKHMRVSICVALYTVLAAIWMPGFGFGSPVFAAEQEVKKTPTCILIPPPTNPIERIEVQQQKTKAVPMPDIHPEDAEPFVEPDLPLVDQMLNTTDDWVIGIPDAPPSQPTEIRAGMRDVESPVITKRVMPKYPPKGLKLRLHGYVILQAVMRMDGTIGDIKVIRGLGKGKFGFEEEAIKSLHKWEFLPGKFQGKPANVILTLKVDFHVI